MDAVSDSTNFAHKSVKSSTNVFFLLPTKFLQPVNLDTFTTWYHFNPLTKTAPHQSVVIIARPPTISLKITDRSFRYASSRLWSQFPA